MPEDEPAAPPREGPPEDVTPVEGPVEPPRPTYHVSIWDEGGPAYVCLLCPPGSPHYSHEAIKEHVPTVHECDAIPTETIPVLLNLRIEADQREAARTASTDVAPAVPTERPTAGPPEEETPHG